MFIDETTIHIKAGNGGNGCYAHERKKYQPRGKPSGGCGGRGGHIYVQGSAQLHTLQDVAYHRSYAAQRGIHGKGSNKDGRSGKDVVIPVPMGTIVIDEDAGTVIVDCLTEGAKTIIAKGGRGGRGNFALVTPKNPDPEQAEFGKPGEEKNLKLVLKVLADVGLVGRPNAGKSTFLSKISRAHPKIADYPFTTTHPNLGIVKQGLGRGSFVVADIPGLIEGSHLGKGLGIRFLKHIERTSVLAILVESTEANPQKAADSLLEELAHYSPLMVQKPKCFILTKIDLYPEGEYANCPAGWLTMSSATGKGVGAVLEKFKNLIDAVPAQI